MKPWLTYMVFPLALIVLVCLGMYHDVPSNAFTGLDDDKLIIHHWDQLGQVNYLHRAFTDDVMLGPKGDYYRPLQLVSYALDFHFFNTQSTPTPDPFLKGNLWWLLVTGALIYLIIKQLTGRYLLALGIALFITIHPATVVAVNGIPGRGEFLITIFSICAIWAVHHYGQTRKTRYLLGYFIALLGGLFSKETAIVIPLIAFLYLLLQVHPNQRTVVLAKSYSWFFIGSLTIVIFWWICRSHALPDNATSISYLLPEFFKMPLRTIIALRGIIIPLPLAVFMGFSWTSLLLSVGVLGVIWLLTKPRIIDQHTWWFGFFWLILFAVPSGLNGFIIYHRLMVVMIGLVFLILAIRPLPLHRELWALAVLGGFILLGSINFQRAFHSPRKFWTNAYTHNPQSFAATNGLAWVHQMNNEPLPAISLFTKSIALNPNLPQNRINLAILYNNQKWYRQADSVMQEEYEVTPDSAMVHFYQGTLFLERGDTAQALLFLPYGFKVQSYNYDVKQYLDTLSLFSPKRDDF